MSDGSKYPPEIFDAILRRLSEGKSLTAVCGEKGMPSKRTVYDRMRKDNDFARRYTMAIEIRAETHVDQLNEINRRLAEDAIDPARRGFGVTIFVGPRLVKIRNASGTGSCRN